ncbi:aspartate-alanine antiporter [Candidatus Aerophobetes bacterium Ae_b3b]|nr:MAG: aspartate-alanine antiporter [Candidatus Aerophobetes bacterium Ae_b3b]
MVDDIVEICRSYPQIVVFLAIAIGYFVGKMKLRGFNIGSTAGVLIIALVLGQMNIKVPPLLKAVSFALFIFCMGYKVGPQFFGALKKEGLHYIWLSLFLALLGLVIAILLGKGFGFDKGTTAGLLAGAMTQSSAIGTAEGAIKHLSISAADQTTLESNVAVAYAITYVFGTAGLIFFFKMIPRLMKIDLRNEARKLEQEMSGGSGETDKRPELFSWYKQLNLRAYRVTNENILGKTVSELEALFPRKIAVQKLKRADRVIDPAPGTVIQSGDVVAMVGDRREFLKADEKIGPEVDDRSVVDLIGEILNICVLNPEAVGKTLGEISTEHGHGCFLRKITRQGHELPLTKNTVVHKCDVLEVAGTQKDIEKLVKHLGYPERPTVMTDLVIVGLGCVLGTLIGLIMVPVMGIPLTLGVGGGVLLSGLVFGWLRSIHPTFGQIPGGAQWVLTDLGLNLFIACVGLTAGPRAIHALQTTGASLLLAGVILTLTPHIIGLIFGRLVLKMNPVLLFGALTGAGTSTATLNALKEEANSPVPVLGYTVPFAFGNVLLTIWGTVLVNVM